MDPDHLRVNEVVKLIKMGCTSSAAYEEHKTRYFGEEEEDKTAHVGYPVQTFHFPVSSLFLYRSFSQSTEALAEMQRRSYLTSV